MGQSYDCPIVSEATLKDMGEVEWYKNTTKQDKVLAIYA